MFFSSPLCPLPNAAVSPLSKMETIKAEEGDVDYPEEDVDNPEEEDNSVEELLAEDTVQDVRGM